MSPRGEAADVVVPVPPFHYLHVLDRNTNITRLVTGPLTFIRKDHERCALKIHLAFLS